MNSSLSLARPLLAAALVATLAASAGCSWFRSHNNDYARSVENRPLEVPPDLDRPSSENALPLPSAAGLGGTGLPPAGFVVAESPGSVWTRIGAVLPTIEGVTVTGSAESLGSYDVNFQGQSFLLRVENTAGQSRVFAISPSGQMLRAGPASILLEQLKGKL
jgi:uncharacterized lipoprotein